MAYFAFEYVRLGVITHIHFIASYAIARFLLPTIPTVKKSSLESIVLLLQGVNSSMKLVNRALVTSSPKTKMMVTIVIQTGSVTMAGMDVVIVLVKDADDPEVEEEEEGHGDVERWPQVNSDPQELVFIEELP